MAAKSSTTSVSKSAIFLGATLTMNSAVKTATGKAIKAAKNAYIIVLIKINKTP